MGNVLGRLEYWLLDVVAEHDVPLHHLPAAEVALNRPSLGAPTADLARGLRVLLDLCLVTLDTGDDASRRVDAVELERFISVPVRIETVRYRRQGLTLIHREPDGPTASYRMTEEGGGEWERAARPDWSRFVESSELSLEDGSGAECEIICADARRAHDYLRWRHGGEVLGESIAHDVVRPFDATYWKRLHEGHRIRFRTGPNPRGLPTPDALLRRPRWDDRWHDDPWEGR